MAERRNIYGGVNSRTGIRNIEREIRKEVDQARSRPALTELYKRAGYLVTLTHAPSWRKHFGTRVKELRDTARHEFSSTVRKINRQAKRVGVEPNYDETWGR
ncbi:hypothetical protein [Vitiosangium sp. GDMCC 1.1324]|uniref:hypothetical protein n=1 Tax=Vitiosangium sp. (strain GDMCC 1.1324) TaxID=2138576 RepID=UPI000D34904C|nr:hypothetical protein [Vitiosangium sp. GDMCC 1.1324]PTL81393.1 hypothetical protein DAT35_25150 [Vitiosangium sp. GDMCC 1.1324]